MITPAEEYTRALQEQFIVAVRESIRRHAAGLLKDNAREVLEKGGEYLMVTALTRFVMGDALPLGLHLMGYHAVRNTVRDSILGIIENEKRRRCERRQENEGLEEASPLS